MPPNCQCPALLSHSFPCFPSLLWSDPMALFFTGQCHIFCFGSFYPTNFKYTHTHTQLLFVTFFTFSKCSLKAYTFQVVVFQSGYNSIYNFFLWTLYFVKECEFFLWGGLGNIWLWSVVTPYSAKRTDHMECQGWTESRPHTSQVPSLLAYCSSPRLWIFERYFLKI